MNSKNQPETGTITVEPNGSKFNHACKDNEGNVIIRRTGNKPYVAAVVFFLEMCTNGEWKPLQRQEKFYFGRKDLIGKGSSAWYYERFLIGATWANNTLRISRCIQFHSPEFFANPK